MLDQTIETLRSKYLKFEISYKGIQRIERPEYPIEALREILLNALIHRSYMGSNTLVRIFDDHIHVWNDGPLPEGMTLDMLKRHHPSRPRNPLLASACFKAGYIDSWGRGILQIIKYSKSYGLLAPEFREYAGGFEVFLRKRTPQVTLQVTPQVEQLLEALKGEMTRSELMNALGLKDREHFRSDYLQPALKEGHIEMTIPNKPNSRLQKYRRVK